MEASYWNPTRRWFKCEACDDYYCSLHDEHVFECLCPEYEDCLEQGFDPYNFQSEYHQVLSNLVDASDPIYLEGGNVEAVEIAKKLLGTYRNDTLYG